VHSVIDLSHSLGMSVVAEGIEDGATLARLAELGCDVGQGFHMSQPIPVPQLEAWMETSRWGMPREKQNGTATPCVAVCSPPTPAAHVESGGR
jgi:predicted signal transduction protein with EAL and GGDEF domain